MDSYITCDWPKTELEKKYHDTEWGIPKHDDIILFEFLVLEMMQAGLSWAIILNKREAMRQAFSNFDVVKISKYNKDDENRLLQNENIIRNRLKIKYLIVAANKFIEIQKEYGSFDKYIWSFVDNKPIINAFKIQECMPSYTPIAEKISKELNKLGFKFVGPTICYSFMQAIGMTDDHLVSCPYHHNNLLKN